MMDTNANSRRDCRWIASHAHSLYAVVAASSMSLGHIAGAPIKKNRRGWSIEENCSLG